MNLIYTADAEDRDFDDLLSYVFDATENREIGFYEIPSFSAFHRFLCHPQEYDAHHFKICNPRYRDEKIGGDSTMIQNE